MKLTETEKRIIKAHVQFTLSVDLNKFYAEDENDETNKYILEDTIKTLDTFLNKEVI